MNLLERSMSDEIEKDWTTKAGLRAVCLMVRNSHRCGYIEVPQGHPLHGVDHSEETDALVFDRASVTIGKKGAILALAAAVDSADGGPRRSPDVAFDVHGGITYSGGDAGYPADGDGWWFGFDCAHVYDGSIDPSMPYMDGPVRTTEFVVSECEDLATQIIEITKKPY